MKRSKFTIFMDILRLIQNENGKAKPTRILYGANLSHGALKENLESLMSKEFIQKVSDNGHTYYKLTKRGYDFINEYRKIKRLTDAFGISI